METNLCGLFDPKLSLRPIVSLKRLDLLEHLDDLSEECLKDLEGELRSDVSINRKEEKIEKSNTSPDDDDEVQIIDEKPSQKKEYSKVEIKREKQELQVKKLRKKALLSRGILKPTVKRITSNTALNPLKKAMTEAMESVKRTTPKKSETLVHISGVMDVVNEKLAVLKERERNLMKNIRTRRKMVIDSEVQEELDALAQLDSAQGPAFNFAKPAPPKVEKVERGKKEKTVDVTIGEQATWKTLQKSSAKNIEEKFRILDARDKLFQSQREKVLDRQQKLAGTCPDMCPEKERLRRRFQNQVSPFEMIEYPRNTETREEWMVKEYARSSADQDTPLPHDLRPVHVLQRTMNHLCRNIADRCEFTDELIEDWYMFMWDRTRAIRKDLTHQDACSTSAVCLLEQCARFHIHCAERLVDQDLSVYDDRINTENLTKCLQTLKYMYNDLRTAGVTCENAPEFLAYSLLLNLNNTAIMTDVRDLPEDILSSEPIRFALDIISARESKNYIRFFHLVKKTSYLNCCILRRYFSEVRVHAFAAMVRAFCPLRLKPVSVPLLSLVESLMFESAQDCATHVKLCNLKVEDREGVIVAILDRKNFQPPEMAFPSLPSVLYIKAKKRTVLSEIMWGGALNEQLPLSPLHSSFNSSGELKKDVSDFKIFDQASSLRNQKIADKEVTIDEVQGYDVEDEEGDVDMEDDYEGEIPESYEDTHGSYEENQTSISSALFAKSIFATALPFPAPTFESVETSVEKAQNPDEGFSFGSTFSSASKKEYAPSPIFSYNQTIAQPPVPLLETTHAPAFSFDSRATSLTPAFSFKPPEIAQVHAISSKPESPKLNTVLPNISSGTTTLSVGSQPAPSSVLEFSATASTTGNVINFEPKITKPSDLTQQPDNEIARKLKEILDQGTDLGRTLSESLQKEQKAFAKLQNDLIFKREMKRINDKEKRRKKRIKIQKMLDEKKRLAEIERKMMSEKLEELKKKYNRWKLQVFARTWLTKTWTAVEGRKMEKYLSSLAISYPPVCGPELLEGNLSGAVIPNVLLVRKCSAKETWHFSPRSRCTMSGPPPALPLVHMGRAVASSLQARIQTLYPDPTSLFRCCFPWKLVLCVPDELETKVRLDTFLEMHFVERFNWKFGVESGPLASCIHRTGNLELVISVRRVKGLQLLEGTTTNSAVQGTNSLLFFLTDESKALDVAKQRFDKLRSLPGGSEIPVVAFVFGDRLSESAIRSSLHLKASDRVVTCGGVSQQSLVTTLSESLSLAADISAPVPSTRSVTLTSLLKTSLLDKIWRRAEKAFVNFDLLLREPQPLINYCNQCLFNLLALFLEHRLDGQTRLAPEFESLLSRLEAPLEMRPAPVRNEAYCTSLKAFFNDLRLPAWPMEPLKNTHDINYRLHQYAKLVVGGHKRKLKDLKWRVYRVIQKTLLWKGLDIYCDENINLILIRFPWTQVLQEFLRSRVEYVLSTGKGDVDVTYNHTKIEHFCYDSSLLDSMGQYTSKAAEWDIDLNDTQPQPEKDSILLGFAKAIEREIEGQEARNNRKPNLSEEVAEILEATLPLLASEPPKAQRSETPDAGHLKRGFQEISDVIADLTNGLEKRRKIIEEMLLED